MANQLGSIKHIVQLMLENRSFDHMLGFARSASWAIDVLTGGETNRDSTGEVARVSSDDPAMGNRHAGRDFVARRIESLRSRSGNGRNASARLDFRT